MGNIYGAGPRGKATMLHAKIVRMRGRCEACGSQKAIQCAHIVSRRYSATRTDLNNAFALCGACHHHYTDFPKHWSAFVNQTIGEEAHEALCQKALAGVHHKMDWEAEVVRLRAILREFEAAA